MTIYLSVNNREEVLTIPVTPAEFSVDLAPKVENFETYSGKNLSLIQANDLQSISWDSFFPSKQYSFSKNNDMLGYAYIDKIEEWIKKKLPIRLIITDTNINIAVAVTSFSYKVGMSGDIDYSISFQEFVFPYDEDDEEELDMATAKELQDQIDYLKATVNQLANPMIYNYIDDNMPEWAKPSVTKAKNRTGLLGNPNEMGLTDDDIKHFTYLDRMDLLEQYEHEFDVPEWGQEAVGWALDREIIQGVGQDEQGIILNLTYNDVRTLVYIYRTVTKLFPNDEE